MRIDVFGSKGMLPNGGWLKGRHITLIRCLALALADDIQTGTPSKGWRSCRWLIAEIARMTGWELAPQAVSAYVCQINKILPFLVETQRGVGYRVREPVEFAES